MTAARVCLSVFTLLMTLTAHFYRIIVCTATDCFSDLLVIGIFSTFVLVVFYASCAAAASSARQH